MVVKSKITNECVICGKLDRLFYSTKAGYQMCANCYTRSRYKGVGNSKIDKQVFIADLKSGKYSFKEIQFKHNVCRATVARNAKMLGLSYKRINEPVTEKIKSKILHDLINTDRTYSQISAVYGVSNYVVYKVKAKAGLVKHKEKTND